MAVVLAVLPAAISPAAQVVVDGSFEATPPPTDNPNWEEGSTAGGTPLCSFAFCGTGGGTAGPRTGSNWAWFGGVNANEDAFLAQTVIIPPGKATLTFYLWFGACSGNGQDYFRVLLDSKEQLKLFEVCPFLNSYTRIHLDVSLFADGGSHTLRLEGKFLPGPAVTNVNVDDVALDSTPVKCGGKTATRVGTNGNDTIVGTSGKDVIAAQGGNDSVKARGGNDLVCGGKGNDRLDGGSGKDRLLGEAGNDKLKGGPGRDTCAGDAGSDDAACELVTSIP